MDEKADDEFEEEKSSVYRQHDADARRFGPRHICDEGTRIGSDAKKERKRKKGERRERKGQGKRKRKRKEKKKEREEGARINNGTTPAKNLLPPFNSSANKASLSPLVAFTRECLRILSESVDSRREARPSHSQLGCPPIRLDRCPTTGVIGWAAARREFTGIRPALLARVKGGEKDKKEIERKKRRAIVS